MHFEDGTLFVPPELARGSEPMHRQKRKDKQDEPRHEADFDNQITGTARNAGDEMWPTDVFDKMQKWVAGEWSEDAFAFVTLPNGEYPEWCLHPKTFEEAVHENNPLRDYFIAAMVNEIKGKMANGEDGFGVTVPLEEALHSEIRVDSVCWNPSHA